MKNEITAKRLQQALSMANMTQQELADKCKINKASISQYINGSHAPSNISSGKMGKALNVNPLWLMGYEVSMKDDRFTEESADLDADVIFLSKEIKEYAIKLSKLSEQDKKYVFDMIDRLGK